MIGQRGSGLNEDRAGGEDRHSAGDLGQQAGLTDVVHTYRPLLRFLSAVLIASNTLSVQV
jgi:hypothetical protein